MHFKCNKMQVLCDKRNEEVKVLNEKEKNKI